MEELIIKVVPSITCPAGHQEVDPETGRYNIRAFKVHLDDGRGWYSECTVCKRWFDENGCWE